MESLVYVISTLLLVYYGFAAPNNRSNVSRSRIEDNIGKEPVPDLAPVPSSKCAGNQLLYPIGKGDDWLCDCARGYIYYPEKDECYLVYRQGPCKKGEHLIWNEPNKISNCVRNPCREGYALFKERCYQLQTPNGPCKPVGDGGGLFGVNLTTLEVECLQGPETLTLFSVPPNCPKGSKRDASNRCRENFNV